MIELIALAAEGGWAYIRRDGDVLLVRPPYKGRTPQVVNEAVVASAVIKYGFVAEEETFPGWSELFAHLRDALERANPDTPSAEEVAAKHWEVAKEDALEYAFARIEDDMIPAGEYAQATRLLTAMRRLSPVLKADDGMRGRALALLADIREAQGEAARILAAPYRVATPLAADRYGDAEEWLSSCALWPMGTTARG